MENMDFLAIGDITTDAFIKLKDAEVNCEIDNTNCKLCLNFGDKIPYEEVVVVPAVGNSPNASVAAVRLGLKSALLSYIGDDRNGAECLTALQDRGVDTSFIRQESGKKTNYHYVLWYGVDRTILVKHESFNYQLGEIGKPGWIYLSSLGENSLDFHYQIAERVEGAPDVKLAFQPGTFQIKFGAHALEKIYKNSEIIFCNMEEAQRILQNGEKDIKKLLQGLARLGPKNVIVTDGIKGAYAHDRSQFWFIPVYPHDP
jgi:ribokinase